MDKQEKILDNFIRKTIKSAEVEKPSVDFTAAIMSQVTIAKQSELTKYKALISKPVWFVIFCTVAGICVYAYLSNGAAENNWLSTIDYSVFKENKYLQFLSSTSLSNSAVYGVIALAVMTIIQVPIYTNYYNKRLRM